MRVATDRLSKSFDSVVALEDVSLELAPGSLVAIVGANGAGKSTLLRCLAGVAVPDGGEIRYDGERFVRARLDLRKRLGFLPDLPASFDGLSLLRNLGIVLSLYDADPAAIEERTVALLREFDLLPLAEVMAGTLSRGQRYKAALAALALADPELWLLDEPFASGMDPDGIRAFRRIAREATGRGRTILYSTQILDLAERFSDRVAVLDRGRLAAFDTVGALGGDGALGALFDRLRDGRP